LGWGRTFFPEWFGQEEAGQLPLCNLQLPREELWQEEAMCDAIWKKSQKLMLHYHRGVSRTFGAL
ncbi:MAG: hypothetical protein OEZ41_13720, partial [Nitrospirota bacterium]|nr:hypothetical protein [Nitrospirota bacterium]